MLDCDGLDADRGSRGRQDDGRLLVPRLRHRVHDAPPEPDQEDVVRPDDAGARHPQEDGGDHHARGVDQRRQGVRQQTVSERFFFFFFYERDDVRNLLINGLDLQMPEDSVRMDSFMLTCA